MAFFKFRFLGQATSSSAPPELVGAGPGESIEVLRRRARHRLMGAVVLVVLAVLVFPLMFDTQPRPVAADTPVLIQDRLPAGPLSAAPLALVPPPPAVLPPDAPSLPVQAGLDANEEQVPAPAVDKPLEQAEPAKSRPIAAKTDVNQPASQAAKPEAKPQDDGSKARALLEGRSQTASKTTAAERHVVQVGAFSDPAKVREIRRKLEQAGVVTFIQVIDGQGGKSTTRIRVGPFNSREEAEKAAARIRQLNFAPAVLRL